jgi:hypothetical protein
MTTPNSRPVKQRWWAAERICDIDATRQQNNQPSPAETLVLFNDFDGLKIRVSVVQFRPWAPPTHTGPKPPSAPRQLPLAT